MPLGLIGLPGLALVSSEEAHRKDLRYLTVTKATCEADVDFVLKGNYQLLLLSSTMTIHHCTMITAVFVTIIMSHHRIFRFSL